MAKVLFSCTTFSTIPPRRCQHFFMNLRHAGIGSCTLCQRALWLLSPITTSWSRRQTNCHRTILVLNRASSRRLRSSGRKKADKRGQYCGPFSAPRLRSRVPGRQQTSPSLPVHSGMEVYLRLPARPCHFHASIVEICRCRVGVTHFDEAATELTEHTVSYQIAQGITRSLVLASLRSATTA